MKTSTGAAFLDAQLDGGYERDIVTTIYGPSGSGKTNLCLLAAVRVAEQGKKVLLIDTEGGIAVERIKQLSKDYQKVLQEIIFLQPLNFKEQQESFERIKQLVNSSLDIGMIVVDSISMLYRLELGKAESVFETNAALARQIAQLVEIARSKKIPVLITNQVYADFNNKERVKMVGGDVLKYGSKCLIELVKEQRDEEENPTLRSLILRKHRYMAPGKKLSFTINQAGLSMKNGRGGRQDGEEKQEKKARGTANLQNKSYLNL